MTYMTRAAAVLNLHASFQASAEIQDLNTPWYWECDGCATRLALSGTYGRAEVVVALAVHQAEELSKAGLLRSASDSCPCMACDPGAFPGYGFVPSHMSVCPNCGNKRCPQAVDHSLYKCTGSNESDQPKEFK